MKALQIASWGGALRLTDVPRPKPAEGQVLVRVEACGIGLTVLNCMQGQLGDDASYLPLTPGHEFVGVIEDVGTGVDAGRIGERIGAYFYLICGECSNCLRERDSLCLRFRGNVGVAIDGGFAEWAVLPALNAIAVPDEVEPALATTIPDAIATPVHVARRSGMGPGSRVVVLAAGGGVGVHMVQVAQSFGADVVGLDVVPAKLEYLEREFEIISMDSSDFGSLELPRSWGGQADVIVDLYGRRPAQRWAIEHLSACGSLVCLTTFRDQQFDVTSRELVQRQLAILGSRYNSRFEQGLAAELVRSGRVRPVVSRTVSVDDVAQTLAQVREGSLIGRAALVW
ncbi:alcohol dehydrogenase catalytic domain-containing protein [Streptomyces sp. NPDC092369]|uniref:alcohol dehydrogenase catalytic domain-containing protein n=1 Tax=Streptomyces sp. NPDC092369 TaxID=3366015 RepID=UPI003820F952